MSKLEETKKEHFEKGLEQLCFTYYRCKISFEKEMELPSECDRECDGKNEKCVFYEAIGIINETKSELKYSS